MGDVTRINDAYCWNITRLAEAFGLSRDTVRKRLREGGVRPVAKRGNADVYALADAGPALFAGESSYQTGVAYSPNDLKPKDREAWFKSENERLKFEENVGDLIPAPTYRDDLVAVFKSLVSFFESLPDKMERRRAFTPAQLEQLETACDEHRAQLYSQLIEVEPDGAS